MSVLLLTIFAAVMVTTVLVGGMVLGVFLRGKPIRHCGSEAMVFNGEQIDCPACGAREQCDRLKKAKAARR
ncbi:MAG: hypothetical protein ACI9TH_002631 [Kiritimatiellia bacterium]|jgi:hypothetical protein